MSKEQVMLSWWMLLLSLLIVGCSSKNSLPAETKPIEKTLAVSAKDVYRHQPEYKGETVAKNIIVEAAMGTVGSSPKVINYTIRGLETDPLEGALNPFGGGEMKAQADVAPREGETLADGNVKITALVDAHVPAVFPVKGNSSRSKGIKDFRLFPDALGSTNIKVAIAKGSVYTKLAGLQFQTETVLNIWQDGTVGLDNEGVEALDKSGIAWVSKKVNVEGKEAILMVKQH